MSFYKKNTKTVSSYNFDMIAFDVNKESKDTYNVNSYYNHNMITNEITSSHEVVKNWSYDALKEGKLPIEGNKYREVIFTGTLKDCYDCIKYIIAKEGHWVNHPRESFKKIFIKPTIK